VPPHRRPLPVVAASLMVATTVLVLAQRPEANDGPDFSEVRALIERAMVSRGTPAMAVAVTRADRILWEAGFGFVDHPGGAPVTPDSRFYCASVTKAFTATALMMLQERHQLNLDHPANDYLKTAKLRSPYWNTDEATVRRVAMQTAGLATYDRSYVQGLQQERSAPDEIIRRYGIVFWRPGSHFDYSNLGFGILGEIVANVSGRSFGDFLRDEIFRPLGMAHSSLGTDARQPGVPRYDAGLKSISPAQDSTMPGASSVYSTAHDLAAFGMFQLRARQLATGPLLSSIALGQLIDPAVDAGGGDRHSLGWWITDDRNGYHTLLAQGGTRDAQAWLLLVPAEQISVVVLGNSGSAPAFQIVDAVLATLLPLYKEARETRSTPPAPSSARTPSGLYPPPSDVSGKWSGELQTYRENLPLTLDITPDGAVSISTRRHPFVVVANPRWSNNRLTGAMAADLQIGDTDGVPYELHLELYRYDNRLLGAATTYALQGKDGPRLSFWVALTRQREP
jgi:CubicO group peptidase (beta-lactamase class C family)